MKTKQFIHEISALSLTCERVQTLAGEFINIYDSNGYCVASISVSKMNQFDTLESDFDELPNQTQYSLFDLLVQFSTTPISERNELSIEEQTKRYIETSIQNNLSFKKSLELLEDFSLHYNGIKNCSSLNRYSDEQIKLNNFVYWFYLDYSNEFVKIWNDVLNSKGE